MHRLALHAAVVLWLAASFSPILRGQTPTPADEPMLPEVEVTPPEGQPVEDFDIPSATGSASNSGGVNLSQSFPNLSDLQFGAPGPFGAAAGILRGSSPSQSLFDAPVAGSIVTPQILREKQATDMFQALQNEVGVHLQRTAVSRRRSFAASPVSKC